MIEIKRVLCPVDFSECSRRAFARAVALARWYQAQLTVLHVAANPLVDLPPIVWEIRRASSAWASCNGSRAPVFATCRSTS